MLNWYFYVFFLFRTSTNIWATRIFQYCVVMQPLSICHQKKNPRKNMSASKRSTVAVIAMRCFTNALMRSPTPTDFVCAVHINACVSALIRNHTRSCLSLCLAPQRPLKAPKVLSIVILANAEPFADNSKPKEINSFSFAIVNSHSDVNRFKVI